MTIRQVGVESFVALHAGTGEGPAVNLSTPLSAKSSMAFAIADDSDMREVRCATCVRTFEVPTWALERNDEHGTKLRCAVCRARGDR